MQREHSRQMRELQQQMLVGERRAEAEQLRTQEEHRETLRLMREQIAGLAAPRPTVAASAPLPTTAQQERAPVVTDSVQSHSVAASVSLPAPAPPATPVARTNLRPESKAPDDDDGEDGDNDAPQGSPPHPRSALRADSAPRARPTVMVAQRSAIPLPVVEQLRQADLIQNGRVLLKWRRQIEDQIEIAEFNDGKTPYEFERRFLMARHTMDDGVRDFLVAHQIEAENGRGIIAETWQQLMLILETHYAPARDAEEASREFYRTKMMPDETMDPFLHRIGGIVQRIPIKELSPNTAAEVVILMIDTRRYPDTARKIGEDQRKHKLENDGRGMDFLTLRNKLPELARSEPNQSLRLEVDALKAQLANMAKGGSGVKSGKQTEKVNSLGFRSFSTMSDDELKKKGWSLERIKALREGACFKCFEKNHMAADCPKSKKKDVAQGN